ncbi:O-acyltransferase like protein isoform X2 [Lingula anatina]|uniref:O-acyltransferase like protein isoform X2 n=1 Tax=Lingula anatina TaxID=7574 RepID=A0A1S3J1E5_LINAN|nr:O-acyltransferase like protein isoform X2 [Lingula anatina]|eukprot:XP_013404076.1 O-acyltransferase like protein isoform X2 [Lingula anatina]
MMKGWVAVFGIFAVSATCFTPLGAQNTTGIGSFLRSFVNRENIVGVLNSIQGDLSPQLKAIFQQIDTDAIATQLLNQTDRIFAELDRSNFTLSNLAALPAALSQIFAPAGNNGNAAQNASVQNFLQNILGAQAPNIDTYRPLMQEALPLLLDQVPGMQLVQGQCKKDIGLLLEGLLTGQAWAMNMFDSYGKPPAGILYGNLKWLGQYDECMRVEATIPKVGLQKIDQHFKGEYCKAYIKFPSGVAAGAGGNAALLMGGDQFIQLGTCFPDSCTSADITMFGQALMGNTTFPGAQCEKSKVPKLSEDPKAIACIAVVSVFAFFLVVGTLIEGFGIDKIVTPAKRSHQIENYVNGFSNGGFVMDTVVPLKEKNGHIPNGNDSHVQDVNTKSNGEAVGNGVSVNDVVVSEKTRVEEPQAPALVRLFTAFSLYTTLPRLLSTHQGSAAITCLNGIRVMSIGWVVLGHTYSFGLGNVDNIVFAFEETKRFSFTAVGNAFFSVDSFFLLSGVLAAYLFLRQLRRENGIRPKTMIMYYVHRIIRLSPLYYMLTFIYATLTIYMGSGPMWNGKLPDGEFCANNWWTNLLYLNNVINNREQCFALSWYIANDFQFYVVAPLFLIPLYLKPLIGVLLLLLGFVGYGLAAAFTLAGMEGGVHLFGNPNFFADYYIIPWCRIGPYLVGLMVGFILYKTDLKIKFNKFLAALCWLVSLGVIFMVVYVRHDETQNGPWEKDAVIAYEVISRPLWALALGWVIIACATGYGGFINTILSYQAWVPLGRLTFAVYFVHVFIITIYQSTRINDITISDFTVAILFTAYITLSYVAALVASLLFEAPILGLEKMILRK